MNANNKLDFIKNMQAQYMQEYQQAVKEQPNVPDKNIDKINYAIKITKWTF